MTRARIRWAAILSALLLAVGTVGAVGAVQDTQAAWTDTTYVSAVAKAGTWSTTPTGASTSVEAVQTTPGVAYAVADPGNTNHDATTMGFCHSFSVTNTTDQPIQWRVVFNTFLPPLWGFNPVTGTFSSVPWNMETVSYDAATGRWEIGGTSGPGGTAILGAGQTIGGMGYCVSNVPVPPIDPASYTTSIAVAPGAGAWYASFTLTATSDRHWNVPWEATIDLAQLVCLANVTSGPTWSSSVTATHVGGSVYTVRPKAGVEGRFVRSGKPATMGNVVSFGLNGAGWQPCT